MSSLSVMDADGTNANLIFRGEEGTLALAPQWSPKDDWIAFGVGFYFAPRSDRPARVMLMRPDGSEPHELTKTAGNSGFPSWSPDGKRIVYRFWSETEYGLRIMNLDDESSTRLTSGFDNFPAWSPKGDLIAFYARIAPVSVPHLRDRPLTLKRYPNGVEAQYFYEKQSPSHRPDWVATVKVGGVDYTLAQDRPTLIWLASSSRA